MSDDGSRSGSAVAAAVRYALFEGNSWLLRSYAAVGSLLAVVVAVVFVLALPTWVTQAGGSPIERVGFGLLWLSGLAIVATLLLPTLFVKRRHELGRPERQALFGLSGYVYVASLYLLLLASAPEDLRDPPAGALAPLVEWLYGLPWVAGLAFVAAGTAVVFALEYGLDR